MGCVHTSSPQYLWLLYNIWHRKCEIQLNTWKILGTELSGKRKSNLGQIPSWARRWHGQFHIHLRNPRISGQGFLSFPVYLQPLSGAVTPADLLVFCCPRKQQWLPWSDPLCGHFHLRVTSPPEPIDRFLPGIVMLFQSRRPREAQILHRERWNIKASGSEDLAERILFL